MRQQNMAFFAERTSKVHTWIVDRYDPVASCDQVGEQIQVVPIINIIIVFNLGLVDIGSGELQVVVGTFLANLGIVLFNG